MLQLPSGVGYGDCYGNEVNFASKLGEDVARGNEILLTESAVEAMSDKNSRYKPYFHEKYFISGVNINSYKLSLIY